jgi:hypothetical protein
MDDRTQPRLYLPAPPGTLNITHHEKEQRTMTPNEYFLSVLHRVTSCRHLATINITIWNGRIEVRHTVFDEMYILNSFPLPNTHNEYCTCMAAACRCLADKLLSWANEYDHGNDILNKQYDTVNKAFRKRLEEQE